MIVQQIAVLVTFKVLTMSGQMNLITSGTADQSTTHWRYSADRALTPPASTNWSVGVCSHTKPLQNYSAWWKVQFPDYNFINHIKIYYREHVSLRYKERMDGLSLFITNITERNISNPPTGILCYQDELGLPYPDPYQDIDCYGIGKNVMLFNNKSGAFIELCYIEVNGCPLKKWSINCTLDCSTNCKYSQCFPQNGSCVYGCNSNRCINDACDFDEVCVEGCIENRAGKLCNKYNNLALQATVTILSGEDNNILNDGDRRLNSCICISTFNERITIDLGNISVVSTVYIHFGNTSYNKSETHLLYGSNSSDSLETGMLLYSGNIPNNDIHITDGIFRYMFYLPPQNDSDLLLEVCEVEVACCHIGTYGSTCDSVCPWQCKGYCNIETGSCMFGCIDGWIGDKCDKQCKQGFYGHNCEKSCSGCLLDKCNPSNGICSDGCKPGWKIVNNNKQCETPCDDWYFGNNCTEMCNCLKVPCDKTVGLCQNGCNMGWKGLACNQECYLGEFGYNCNGYCSYCVNHTCDIHYGLCTYGCIEGYENVLCGKPVSNRSVDYNIGVTSALAVGVVLVAILLAAVLIFLLRRRYMNRQKVKNAQPEPITYDLRSDYVNTGVAESRYDALFTASSNAVNVNLKNTTQKEQPNTEYETISYISKN